MYSVFDCVFYKTTECVREIAPLLKKHGIQGLSVPRNVVEDIQKRSEAKRIVNDLDIKWGLIPTPADFYAESIDDNAFTDGLETLKRWAESAGELGLTRAYNHIHPGSNFRIYEDNFYWYAQRVERVNSILKGNGIFYGLEFVGPVTLKNSFKYPFISTLSGALALADMVDRGIGILFDTFHWFCGSGNMDDVYYLSTHIERLLAVHVNDGISGRTRFEQDDGERAMPMTTGIIDSKTICRKFVNNGYDGPVICEPMDPAYKRFENMDAEAVVIELAEAYTRLF